MTAPQPEQRVSDQRLSITHARAGERRLLVVAGEVELDSAPRLTWVFARAGQAGEPIAVDLGQTQVDDNGGMALLVNGVRRLHRFRHDVIVVCPPGPVRSAFERAGLARRLTVLDDPAALPAPLPDPVAVTQGPTIVDGHRQRASTPVRRGRLLAEATLAIEARHADPGLDLDQVARAIATSSRQLQRVFTQLAGSAFRDELAAVRMQHAAAMLQTTDLPVAEIARRVGYRQAAQFAKAFRRHHGESPSGFRRAASASG
jgi:AraC family transcriptional regulator of adaptative response / methylphosphotriester-DNA alkyltransferase methyltransferase